MCAAFATIGGLLFGYDQGVISVTLVMDQFLGRFPRVSSEASGAGFWKGLMTAMLELGALIGALFAGWLADKLSRKHSIVVAVIVFTIGSILQTAAVEYGMLTFGRLIGGMGIGAYVHLISQKFPEGSEDLKTDATQASHNCAPLHL